MSARLARVTGLFLAPPRSAPRPSRARTAPGARSVVLCCRPSDAGALGSALALALAGPGGAALVCDWTAGTAPRPPVAAPSWPAARRLAARLAGHGIAARCAGRVARVALPADAAAALAAAGGAMAVADGGGIPAVLVLAAARPPELAALLGQADVVVVATRSDDAPGLVGLAVAGATVGGRPALAWRPGGGLPARILAASGVAAPRSLAVPVVAGP